MNVQVVYLNIIVRIELLVSPPTFQSVLMNFLFTGFRTDLSYQPNYRPSISFNVVNNEASEDSCTCQIKTNDILTPYVKSL
jgi:hypothetical protein